MSSAEPHASLFRAWRKSAKSLLAKPDRFATSQHWIVPGRCGMGIAFGPCGAVDGAMRIMGLLNWFKSLFFRAPTSAGVSPFRPDTGPARLIVLRHAEKTGDRRDRDLSPAGHERAMRLVPYVLETFGRPDFLIAAKSSDRSRRPVETIEPLAAADISYSSGSKVTAKRLTMPF